MGAENSALGSCVLKEPPFTLPSGLAVYPAVLQDGKLASVFVYKRENEDKVHKAAQHLKTLRHPCLLRFLSCTVEADGIHLVTERVQPLAVALETLSSAEVCAGIYDILLALIFLHDRGHLTHNNVCLSSVFVSEDGHWKLGGMETVCRVSQATPEFLRSIRSVRDPAGIPPEEKSPEFTALPESHGHARDAYAFGTLVERVLSVLSGQVSADALSSFQQNLHSALLNPSPKCRPALSTLLSHDFFRNDFLEIVNFLKSLTLKSEEEKTEFFKKPGNSSARVLFATTCPRKFLLDRVSCLSEELVASRLVPLLLNQLVFAEPVAVKSFLPHLLGPKKALFQASVVPVLLQLFQVHEEHVRMVLLSHLEAYVGHFTQGQLRTVILPQVLLGLRDTSNSIVAITLHSLAVLVSLLGPEVVVGGQRTKIFKRTAPSFAKAADLAPEGDRLPQPVKRPVNGIADGNGPSGHGADLPSSSRPPEEWPDWSEPEETDDRTGSAKAWPPEPRPAAGSPRADLTVVEVWSDPETNPGTGTTAGEHAATPTAHPLPEGSAALTSGQQQTTSPAPGVGDPGQPPEAPSRERRLKTPTEVGLGEEFTIQVKRRPAPDPELDWFADMIPEITPPAALLVLPDLRTETGAPNKERASPVTPFSSKFAAADITEAESEGWGDEGELNWEDNSW